MTLVVARQAPTGAIRVTADMRLTDAAEIRRGFPFAVLKNVIFSPTVLVAYAGNADLATHALRAHRDTPLAELAAPLFDAACQGGEGPGGVEFLIAETGEGIRRIRHTGIESPAEATWIGAPDAFEAYQRHFHSMPAPVVLTVDENMVGTPGPAPPGTEEVIRMASAFQSLIAGEAHPAVGELAVSAFSRDGFHYEPQAMLAADHEQVIDSTEWVSSDWGTVANGGFGYALLHPVEPGIGLVGLYFPHARLGLLYHPLAHELAIPYRDLDGTEFRAAILDDHGVAIDGPGFS